MADKFWLHPKQPLTVEALENISSQRVSICFSPDEANNSVPLNQAFTLSDFSTLALGLGEEVPGDIIKLMLLLLADFLTKQPIADNSLAILHLLEFHQYEVFPQVYTQGLYASPTAHLLLPLYGLGKVYYQGYLLNAADVHDIFSWRALTFPEKLPGALLQTSFLGLASLIHTFMQVKKLFRYGQLVFRQAIFINSDDLFTNQLEQLEVQLNEVLTASSEQAPHVIGLSYQLEKLLTKYGEHIAENFSKPDNANTAFYSLKPGFQINPPNLHALLQALSQENIIQFETDRKFQPGTFREVTNSLVMRPFRMLLTLEKLMAIASVLQLGSTHIMVTDEQNTRSSLVNAYRNQVISVLKETVFAELIRKTVAFMYATVQKA